MTNAKRLRQLLANDGAMLVPGAYNPLVARILELDGFEAIYAGGYAAAAAGHGLPDIGLVTMSELTDHLARITRVIDIPLIADADTGFGDLTNTARAVREYERAGAAAVQIEDQVFPKRCGHMEGKKVIPAEKMVEKVRAALAARSNPDTVIIARTDAIAVTGLDDAIARMKAYEAAGADVIFPDAPTSTADMSTIRAEVGLPSSRTCRSMVRRRSSRALRSRSSATTSRSTRPRPCSRPPSRHAKSHASSTRTAQPASISTS